MAGAELAVTVLGLVLGAGLLLVWLSCWSRPVRPVRRRGRLDRLAADLQQAGIAGVSPGALVGWSVAGGGVVAAVCWAASGAWPVALCFGGFAAVAPAAWVRGRARKRRLRLRGLWPEVADQLTSAVRAGLALPEALAQLGERGPEELRRPFRRFGADYRSTGRFSPSLDALKDELADPVADRIVEALRLTSEVGGPDVGRLLRTLSGFLREDARVRSELEARQSWTVGAARLAGAAPWIVLALLITRPEGAEAFASGTGTAVLFGGLVTTVVGYRLMIRLGRLPEESRVLR